MSQTFGKKSDLKQRIKNSRFGPFLVSSFETLYTIYRYRVASLMPEKFFVKRMFRKKLGYELDLENPKTFNGKIQWLKLNEREPLQVLCTDKYAVRDYIREKIGEAYLIPLLYHTDDPADITPETLPNVPHIIKANHNSGGAIVVRDKSKLDYKEVQKSLKVQLGRNYYNFSREWQYKDIEPRIIVEKLLLDEQGKVPKDYKFHCLNGELAFIQVDLDRYSDHRRNLYDPDWNFIDCQLLYEKGGHAARPPELEQMKALAETIAQDFRLVRVDFYNVGERVYFGELTFYPGNGFEPFTPRVWDRTFGDRLTL